MFLGVVIFNETAKTAKYTMDFLALLAVYIPLSRLLYSV